MHATVRAFPEPTQTNTIRLMSAIRTNAAAALLGVSQNTLRGWESRFGHPTPARSEGGHRQYELAEIEALRQALVETGEIGSAIAIVRERGESGASPARLQGAFAAFDASRADRVLEESMAMRSLERTVETVLLTAVQTLAAAEMARPLATGAVGDSSQHDASAHPRVGGDAGGPEYCFAWRYATGWLSAAQRVAPPSTREQGVLIFDASAPFAVDALYAQALELFLRRAGLRVLALPVGLDSARVGTALRALEPDALVLAGSGASLDAIGRLVYAARRGAGELDVLDFRDALPDSGASTVRRIGPGVGDAAKAVVDRITRGSRRDLQSSVRVSRPTASALRGA
ncbi:MAG TPA: MerR family transcriptional regulator [Solirubrobacteraceae bacterium]|jgi:DNA-binding transcriptional MerR regulator|nr:MerR family transcriptional regulator [Solirubrobacteraceae bacterium]